MLYICYHYKYYPNCDNSRHYVITLLGLSHPKRDYYHLHSETVIAELSGCSIDACLQY